MRNDFQVREQLAKGGMPARNKNNFRPTKSGAGMTEAIPAPDFVGLKFFLFLAGILSCLLTILLPFFCP